MNGADRGEMGHARRRSLSVRVVLVAWESPPDDDLQERPRTADRLLIIEQPLKILRRSIKKCGGIPRDPEEDDESPIIRMGFTVAHTGHQTPESPLHTPVAAPPLATACCGDSWENVEDARITKKATTEASQQERGARGQGRITRDRRA